MEFQETRSSVKIPLPDHVRELLAALCSVGFFKQSVLIGSWAISFYRAIYDIRFHFYTSDIDLAVQVVTPYKDSLVNLEELLNKIGYVPFISGDGLQRFIRSGYNVEFIVHDQRKKATGIVSVPEWNINAQPLPFVRLLLDFTETVYTDDFYVRIPIPEAFFFHKLIIAQRRRGEKKRKKDLSQCGALITILNDERLRQVVASERLSKATKHQIKRSCESIEFPFCRLEL